MARVHREEGYCKKIQARALFEKGGCTQKEIAKTVGVTEKTLKTWMNKDKDNNDPWKVGVLNNEVYDIAKISQKNKILKQFKNKEEQYKDDILTKKAQDDARREAELIIDLTKERNRLMRETLERYRLTGEYIDKLLARGETTSIVEEDVIWEGRKMYDYENECNLKKKTIKIDEHKIYEIVKANELNAKVLFGLGVCQTTPPAQSPSANNIEINDVKIEEKNAIITEYINAIQKKAPKQIEATEE